mmetsp:Transcript_40748/g.49430  ORF Transcript_40748/g.49430 Transcript_40748/m.49430 type:complete len:495 (-) Transcript_40748:583-2067(-)|eukprot:CAMPEP_0197857684 /NCGR_PEP_ID=MMETSP1438-20131217/31007_1 /TAXON_ID=1461541 /ORGANISM="Pterosperma sp., Strain CCMP1384" /LENGTH=494 /DNA_ID=CAMNT_0043473607 /DNA_START=709 /DNA_END=2193 /DNA_ORIENTATION=+
MRGFLFPATSRLVALVCGILSILHHSVHVQCSQETQTCEVGDGTACNSNVSLPVQLTEEEQMIEDMRLEEVLDAECNWRLQALGRVSDQKDALVRTFFSSAHRKSASVLKAWMEDAGMDTWVDAMGNVHGRAEGTERDAPVLLFGSHYDTVVDGGKYDGALGIVVAIQAVKALTRGRVPLKKPVQVVAFSDEEGVRFQSTFLGSRAVSGTFPPELLENKDADGTTMAEVLDAAGLRGDIESIKRAALKPEEVAGYVEVHMEQGPQLERLNLPVGPVAAIAGQTRLTVVISGDQGHAGTVPMLGRRDSMATAAEIIVDIEKRCNGGKHPDAHYTAPEEMLVCTVGEVRVWPGASNVISGAVNITIDMRARRKEVRLEAVDDVIASIHKTCARRDIDCQVLRKHDAEATECSPSLTERLMESAKDAKVGEGREDEIPVMISGAGHDALAMAAITPIAMLFVKCFKGISHSPLEYVAPEDVAAATRTIYHFLLKELT